MEPYPEGNRSLAKNTEEVTEDWTWIESADLPIQPSPPCQAAFEVPGTDASDNTTGASAANTSACHSPTSEMVADMVLEQPLLPHSESRPGAEAPVAAVAAAAAAAAAAAVAAVAAAASSQKEDQQQQQQQQQSLPKTAPKSSPVQRSLAAVTSAASSWLSTSSEVAWLAVEEARQDLSDFLLLLEQATALTHAGLQHVKGAISLWIEGMQQEASAHADHLRDAACSCIKWAMEQRIAHCKGLHQAWQSPPWTLISVGAVTALSTVAIGTLVWTNHSLSHQLRTRDRELATLFLHIGNLQETLRSSHASVPIMQLLMQPGSRSSMISSLI